ncbi:MAG: hypothetical protein OXE99_03235, partial [Cellvibrionales bacterium]|nr:hypothetical protein [Cellvibrionales bacterium]
MSLVFACLSLNAFGAPGIISQIPLDLPNQIPSNLMLLQDSSGSMTFDLVQECQSSYSCDYALECSKLDGNNDGYIDGWCPSRANLNLGTYPSQNGNFQYSEGKYGFEEIHATQGYYVKWADRWYAGCTALTTPATKTCVSSREFMVKREASSLINRIDGFNVGLMRFHRSGYGSSSTNEGGILLRSMTLLDSNRSDYGARQQDFRGSIASIVSDGSTPLSESMAALGHYFAFNTPSSPIVTSSTGFVMNTDYGDVGYEHVPTPKNAPQQKALNAIFTTEHLKSDVTLPTYNSSGANDHEKSQNMAIKGWCQRNFAIVLTDGEPTRDSTHQTFTQTYEAYTGSGETKFNNLVNIAGALWDMDLRPDLCDPSFLDELNDLYGVGMNNCTDMLTTSPVDDARTIYQILEEELEEKSDDNLVSNDGKLHRYKNNVRTYLIGFASFDASETGGVVGAMKAAARVGGGKYFNANSGAQLQSVFTEILNTIEGGNASSSGIGVNLVRNANGSLFQSRFDASNWTGTLGNYPIFRQIGRVNLGDEAHAHWTTSEPDTFLSENERVVVSYDPIAHQPIPFRWEDLSANNPIRTDLSAAPDGTTDQLGEKRLKYLRGD